MPNLVEQYPGLIFFAIVIAMLLYGCAGGVKAFCPWWGIELKDRRMEFWIAVIVSVFVVLMATTALVFSGVFMQLLGLAVLFVVAYAIMRLVMIAVSK